MNRIDKVRKKLQRGAFEAFLTRLIGFGFLFLLQIMLTRSLGLSEYGIYSYVISIVGVLSVIVPLGWATSLIRYYAEYKKKKHWSYLRGFLIRASQVTLITAITTSIILLCVGAWPNLSVTMTTSIKYAALLLPVLSFIVLLRKAFQALSKVKSSIVPDEVLLPAILCLGIYLLPVTDAENALKLYFAIALIILIGAFIWLLISLPYEVRITRPKYNTKMWMTVTFPMMLGGLSQIIMNRTDILMIGAIIDMNAVGLYSVANRIALLNVFILSAINTIAAPLLASAYQSDNRDRFKSVLVRTMLWSTSGAIPLTALVFLYPEKILLIFGVEFVGASTLLKVLAIGQLINAMTGSVGFGLLVSGEEKLFAYSMSLTALFNLVGNIFVIPIWGAIGAAIVTAVSIVILNSFQLWLLWSKKINKTKLKQYI